MAGWSFPSAEEKKGTRNLVGTSPAWAYSRRYDDDRPFDVCLTRDLLSRTKGPPKISCRGSELYATALLLALVVVGMLFTSSSQGRGALSLKSHAL